jgi:hypothetical protein
MSLNIIRKNSSSPFNQQRSMVNQSGEGGAYESGGFDPNNVHDSGGEILNAIVGFGSSIGAGLSSVTAEDRNEADKSKVSRLEKRKEKIKGKNQIDPRITRIEGKIEKTNSRINKYNEFVKPTLKSSIYDE